MAYLLAVSLLWGFSFGLVKAEFSVLSGSTLALMRLLIALPCFLPFLKSPFRRPSLMVLKLLLIGAFQYGLMYVCLFSAFQYLTGYEVALLTIFTPVYVIMADAILENRWPPSWFWLTSGMAVAGALWIFQPASLPAKVPGILLMQGANLCFATGQVAYRQFRKKDSPEMKDRDGYAWLFLGGILATLPFALPKGPLTELADLGRSQWLALVYLGAVASGVGFFLWNAGAVKVNAATLAIFNNLKIPLATVIAIVVFGEQAALDRLIPGLLIMLVALAWAEFAHQKWVTTRS
ncbi:MAG TPA: EamA family transporter [Oceanipulchritudo sp.]|nr:EamA family transporter [Oceanipulchritudo sp.]